MSLYGLLRGSDARLRGTNEAVMMRPAMHPLKILAAVGAVFLMWGLLFAYASSPAQAATLAVNSLADGTPSNDGQCTLREAILNANANDQSGSTDCAAGSGSDAIRVGVSGTVQLSGALPNLASNMQIVGPGADQFTVRRDTGGDYRIFTVVSGSVVSISGITISNGNVPGSISSSNGGGILNNGGSMTITSSAISGNSTGSNGGGVANRRGTLTITGSTISGNRAGNEGGGVYSLTSLSGPTTTITNSTISGNSSTNRGGGVFNGDGLTVLENCTIAKNTAPSGEGSGVASFGSEHNRTEVLSSIISANTNTDVDFTTSSINTFVSKGYNLIGNGNATGAFDQGGDHTNVNDPKLGALAGNGGPTETHALLAGSPAIDKGMSSDLATDQRGKKRPFDDPSIAPASGGDDSDIGSFEAQSVLDSAPQAADDAYDVTEDTALTVAAPGVLTNDTDLGNTPTAVLVGGPSHADSFGLNADGSFSYTPKKDYSGPDLFTYKATGGSADSNVATVNITVGSANNDPAAEDDSATTDEDTAITISVLANDSDADGGSLSVGSFTNGTHGTVTKSTDGTKLTYKPNAD
jgi:CSLREA domain-containing protein